MLTKIIAHRGVSAYAPENTLSAFRLAVKLGADGIELDVQRTKDGVLVVCHDQFVDRTTNGTGAFSDLTWDEIRHLYVYDKSRKSSVIEHVPTLRDVLAILPNRYLVNIEVKTSPSPYPNIEQQLTEELQKYGRHLDLIVSSFNHHSVLAMQSADKALHTGILYEGGFINIWEYVQRVGLSIHSLHPYLDHVDDQFVDTVHQKGYAVYAYVANTEEEILRMLSVGVDGMITDRVEMAKRMRAQFLATR